MSTKTPSWTRGAEGLCACGNWEVLGNSLGTFSKEVASGTPLVKPSCCSGLPFETAEDGLQTSSILCGSVPENSVASAVS